MVYFFLGETYISKMPVYYVDRNCEHALRTEMSFAAGPIVDRRYNGECNDLRRI